jgi:hypothetical protein
MRLHHLHLDIAAQLDVGAAAGHVGGDGHRAELARHRRRSALLARAGGRSARCADARLGQHLAQHLGFLDRGGADQDRLALLVRLRISSTMASYFSRAVR